MLEIAVWEDEDGLANHIAALAGEDGLVHAALHPEELAGKTFDLLVVAPKAAPGKSTEPLRCRAALVPGGRPELSGALSAFCLVSYGMGRADTLTLSGLWEGRAALCVQRAFPDLDEGTVERQELVLPYDGPSPELFLARTGAALLLGKVARDGKIC